MISVMVRYRIKKEKIKDILKAIKKFVKNIEKRERGTLLYKVFRIEKKSNEFVHFMIFEDAKAEEIHKKSEYVKKFVSILYPLCEKKPVFVKLNYIK